jgi:lysophospholipid acyltransferase (LPLAT)-like uncharacterized protein
LRQRLAAVFVVSCLRAIALTVRFRLDEASIDFVRYAHTPCIFSIWHNRLSLCLFLYRRFIWRTRNNRALAAMVSASRDGGLLARILELLNVQPVRGSSSRRGSQALRELVSWAEKGYDLAITPDGPRGPRYRVQDGVTALAQLTGLPVIPVSYHLQWKIQAGSWDRFQIPLPFTKCLVRVGEPVQVPREATDEEREQLRTNLERRMQDITED